MDSSEPRELDLLDCEDVIYSCNLFGDCGWHQWSSLSGRWAVLGQSPFSVRCLPGLWCGLRGFEPVTYVSCLAPELRTCAAPALTKNLFCPCLATICPVPGSLSPKAMGYRARSCRIESQRPQRGAMGLPQGMKCAPSLSQGFLGTELHPLPTMCPSASWQGVALVEGFYALH